MADADIRRRIRDGQAPSLAWRHVEHPLRPLALAVLAAPPGEALHAYMAAANLLDNDGHFYHTQAVGGIERYCFCRRNLPKKARRGRWRPTYINLHRADARLRAWARTVVG